jgi:hypothetical protein
MDDLRGPGRCKCKFAPCEDVKLTQAVRRYGCGNWAAVALPMPGRNPRQCRERRRNYIDPNLEHSPLTSAEERLLGEKFGEYGARWQIIASSFPERERTFSRTS